MRLATLIIITTFFINYSMLPDPNPEDEAFIVLQKSGDTSLVLLSRLATDYISIRQYDKAIPYLLQAFRIDTLNYGICDMLGECYYETGDLQKSIYFYRKITENPGTGDRQTALAYTRTGDVQKEAGLYRDAIRSYLDALERMEMPNNYLLIAGIFDNYLHNTAEAILYYGKYLDAMKDNINIMLEDHLEKVKLRMEYLRKSNDTFTPGLVISENHRYLATENGDPFFWLGDTGWLLFKNLSREEAAEYLDDRKAKGFNVIQVMVIHDINRSINFYGDSAISARRLERPVITNGNSPDDPQQYDYWDHVDYIVNLAGHRGIYIAMVPVWGSNVRSGKVSRDQACRYTEWLALRYRDNENIIWVNGGDVQGTDSTGIWNAIGETLRRNDPGYLITYHPFGRTQSSMWFHNASWLDFNMFQSGHRRYDQDTAGLAYGEDNWKYMMTDYNMLPVKPSLDAEPSYEAIPQGLHDGSQPRWTDSDVRRYAYWSVFAGACGFTYGHNAIMQFHKQGNPEPAYSVMETWEEALNAPGASQMIHLKELILSKPYFERRPAQELLVGPNGEKHDYTAVTRGGDYVFVYTWTGRDIEISTDLLHWDSFKASWYDPRTGSNEYIGTYSTGGSREFDPLGEKEAGNDWVLVLEKK